MTHTLKDIFPDKVKVTISDNQINIDVHGNTNLIEGDFGASLMWIGFKKNTDGTGFFIITNDVESMTTQLIDIFEQHKIEIQGDNKIQETITTLQKLTQNLQSCKKIGMEIKQGTFPYVEPKHFKKDFVLKMYQIKPVVHMVEAGNSANFSIPGAGKTAMTYAAYDILKEKEIVDQLFVVGPLASFVPWEEEFKSCFGLDPLKNVLRYIGKDRHKLLNKIREYPVVITSYHTAANDLDYLKRELLEKGNIMMVIDESHHIKSFEEDSSHANAMISLGSLAKRRYILSGTPMPRDYEDLWSQVTFLWPNGDVLGSRARYSRFVNEGRNDEIADMINFLWTRIGYKQLKKDLPIMYKERPELIPMNPIQEEIYKSIESDLYRLTHTVNSELFDIEELKKNRILRMLQAATNPRLLAKKDKDFDLDPYQTDDRYLSSRIQHYNEIPNKIQRAAELARQIVNKGKSVIIWTTFRDNVEYLCNEILSDMKPIPISGEVNIKSDEKRDYIGREERLENFKKREGQILVATAASISESVSLHLVCQNAIYLERSFNAGQFMQSMFRIYRIGSDKNKPVRYHFLQSVLQDNSETIDARIDEILSTRSTQLSRLLDDEERLTPMSLEVENYKIKGKNGSEYYGLCDNPSTISKNINEMIEKHKKQHKI